MNKGCDFKVNCLRCKNEFSTSHPLNLICLSCLEKKPQLSIKEKAEMNLWDNADSFFPLYQKMKSGDWCWTKNMSCKYIDIRIDMRDGGCLLYDKNGNRISFERLAWQYSNETPEPPE
jgi:hypothetical protein